MRCLALFGEVKSKVLAVLSQNKTLFIKIKWKLKISMIGSSTEGQRPGLLVAAVGQKRRRPRLVPWNTTPVVFTGTTRHTLLHVYMSSSKRALWKKNCQQIISGNTFSTTHFPSRTTLCFCTHPWYITHS